MPNLSGLIFSTVAQFVLQPERTKVVTKRDNLDTLAEVYTGPAGGEDSFIPAIGSQHPNYNLMTLISGNTKQMPALVVEVTLNYQGKLANSGTGRYTSVPTISRYWQEGEIGYEEGYYTYSHRYTGRCVTINYITNNIPSGNESNLGLAKEFLGFTNEWKQLVSINPGGGFTVSQLPIKKMTCTDVRIEDQGDGWFKVTETYMSRMFPGTATMSTGASQIPAPQRQTGPFIVPGTPVKDWYATTPNLFGQDRAAALATGAAQAQADQQNMTYVPTALPSPTTASTTASSTDQQVYGATALDPAAGSVPYATSAASAAVVHDQLDIGGSNNTVSVPLDY